MAPWYEKGLFFPNMFGVLISLTLAQTMEASRLRFVNWLHFQPIRDRLLLETCLGGRLQ